VNKMACRGACLCSTRLTLTVLLAKTCKTFSNIQSESSVVVPSKSKLIALCDPYYLQPQFLTESPINKRGANVTLCPGDKH